MRSITFSKSAVECPKPTPGVSLLSFCAEYAAYPVGKAGKIRILHAPSTSRCLIAGHERPLAAIALHFHDDALMLASCCTGGTLLLSIICPVDNNEEQSELANDLMANVTFAGDLFPDAVKPSLAWIPGHMKLLVTLGSVILTADPMEFASPEKIHVSSLSDLPSGLALYQQLPEAVIAIAVHPSASELALASEATGMIYVLPLDSDNTAAMTFQPSEHAACSVSKLAYIPRVGSDDEATLFVALTAIEPGETSSSQNGAGGGGGNGEVQIQSFRFTRAADTNHGLSCPHVLRLRGPEPGGFVIDAHAGARVIVMLSASSPLGAAVMVNEDDRFACVVQLSMSEPALGLCVQQQPSKELKCLVMQAKAVGCLHMPMSVLSLPRPASAPASDAVAAPVVAARNGSEPSAPSPPNPATAPTSQPRSAPDVATPGATASPASGPIQSAELRDLKDQLNDLLAPATARTGAAAAPGADAAAPSAGAPTQSTPPARKGGLLLTPSTLLTHSARSSEQQNAQPSAAPAPPQANAAKASSVFSDDWNALTPAPSLADRSTRAVNSAQTSGIVTADQLPMPDAPTPPKATTPAPKAPLATVDETPPTGAPTPPKQAKGKKKAGAQAQDKAPAKPQQRGSSSAAGPAEPDWVQSVDARLQALQSAVQGMTAQSSTDASRLRSIEGQLSRVSTVTTKLEAAVEDAMTKITGISKSIGSTVRSSVASELPAAAQTAVNDAVQTAFREAFMQAIVPAFESAVREMFSQVSATLNGGLRDFLAESTAVGSTAAARVEAAVSKLEHTVTASASTSAAAAGATPHASRASPGPGQGAAGGRRAAPSARSSKALDHSAAVSAATAAVTDLPSATQSQRGPSQSGSVHAAPQTGPASATAAPKGASVGDVDAAFTRALEKQEPWEVLELCSKLDAAACASQMSEQIALCVVSQLSSIISPDMDKVKVALDWIEALCSVLDFAQGSYLEEKRQVLADSHSAIKAVVDSQDTSVQMQAVRVGRLCNAKSLALPLP